MLVTGFCWVMGDGKNINLRHDKWLSDLIFSLLNIINFGMSLSSFVSALICDDAQCILDHFLSSFL